MVWRLSITSFKPNVTKYIECLVIVCNQSKISSIDQSDRIAWSTSGTCTFPCVQRISTQSKWIDFNLVTRRIFLNWSKYCHLFNWTKKKHCNTVNNDDFWIWIWTMIFGFWSLLNRYLFWGLKPIYGPSFGNGLVCLQIRYWISWMSIKMSY